MLWSYGLLKMNGAFIMLNLTGPNLSTGYVRVGIGQYIVNQLIFRHTIMKNSTIIASGLIGSSFFSVAIKQ